MLHRIEKMLGMAMLATATALPRTSAQAAAPGCWSLLTSKYGPSILHAVEEAGVDDVRAEDGDIYHEERVGRPRTDVGGEARY